ncbi:MAG: hypothetical protein AABZ31_11970 [Bdellovibrionota bacterium]
MKEIKALFIAILLLASASIFAAQKTTKAKTIVDSKPTIENAAAETQSSITITGDRGIDYVVIAPNGKKVGYDADSKETFDEVEGSNYSNELGTENLDEPNAALERPYHVYSSPNAPMDGIYKIEMYSDRNDEYSFEINVFYDDQKLKMFKFTGQLKSGKREQFQLKFSKTKPPELIRPKGAK